MIRPTDSEIQTAAADPNGLRLCVFCHAPLGGRRFNGTPTCSHYCYSNEFATLLQIHTDRTSSFDGRGRGWLSL